MKLKSIQEAHGWVNPKEIEIAFRQTRFHVGKVEQWIKKTRPQPEGWQRPTKVVSTVQRRTLAQWGANKPGDPVRVARSSWHDHTGWNHFANGLNHQRHNVSKLLVNEREADGDCRNIVKLSAIWSDFGRYILRFPSRLPRMVRLFVHHDFCNLRPHELNLLV